MQRRSAKRTAGAKGNAVKRQKMEVKEEEREEIGEEHSEQADSSSSLQGKKERDAQSVPDSIVMINRAPVLTLWVSVVAEKQGYDKSAALTFGKAIAGMFAQTKGRSIGIFEPRELSEEEERQRREERRKADYAQVFGRKLQIDISADGVRAKAGGRPIQPQSVQSYLKRAFKDRLEDVRGAMEELAEAVQPVDQLDSQAYHLYEQFRPAVAAGTGGWGKPGKLDLHKIREVARDLRKQTTLKPAKARGKKEEEASDQEEEEKRQETRGPAIKKEEEGEKADRRRGGKGATVKKENGQPQAKGRPTRRRTVKSEP